MSSLRSKLPGLPRGVAVVVAGIVAGLTPPPSQTVSQWAEEKRYVSAESGSPFPGRWSNDKAPYMREVMDCLSFDHPCRDVTLCKSHQVAGSEAGINKVGETIDREPAPILIVLPTLDEASKYNRVKLVPTIEATPCLRGKVKESRKTSEKGSTASYKRFRGGFLQLTGANSSAGLQMISVRLLICEEISEWPAEAGDRGDPLAQAEKRTTAWSKNRKRFYVSTPGLKGVCRITAKYEDSDQRRYYVPCPHCGTFQILKREQFKRRQDHVPFGAFFDCLACGCQIEEFQKEDMVAAGVWLRTFEDGAAAPGDTVDPEEVEHYRARSAKGREPGFHIWQAYSNLVTWDDTMADIVAAEDDEELEKTVWQQVYGEAYEVEGEAPDHEKLFLMREDFPQRRMPVGALVNTGFCDVQGNRLEWSVFAWGIGMSGWLIDKGVIVGDPEDESTWRKLDEVIGRQYEDCNGRLWPIEAFGVDAGYMSHAVYNYCRSRELVMACDGRDGHLFPPIGTPSKVDVTWSGKTVKGGCVLWPTGTWGLKASTYRALRKTLMGPDEDGFWQPGALHFPMACDQHYFQQLTAEHLKEVQHKNGSKSLKWVKPGSRANEALDIAVGARAMACHLQLNQLSLDQWAKIASERGAPEEQAQRDLAALWNGPPVEDGEDAEDPTEAPEVEIPAVRESWIERLAKLNG